MLNLGPILAITRKDLLLLARDKSNAFFTFVFPLLVALFFGAIFGGGGNGGKMDVAVVDEDRTPSSQAFVADLAGDEALNVIVEAAPGQALTPLQGADMVRKGRVVAAITVPKGFGEGAEGVLGGGAMQLEAMVAPGRSAEAGLLTGKLNEMAFRQFSRTFGDSKAMSRSLDRARAMVNDSTQLDPARRALFGAMFSSIDALNKDQALVPNSNDAKGGGKSDTKTDTKPDTKPDTKTDAKGGLAGWNPVQVKISTLHNPAGRPSSAWEISFPQGVVWGLMGCVMAFGTSITMERGRGTWQRLTAAPMTRGDILAGKALACFVTCVLVQTLLLGMGVLVFGVKPSSAGLMAASVGVTSLGFVGVMMLIAGMSRSEGGATGMARAVLLVLAMIGGGSVPTFFLPSIVQKFSVVSPFTWATRAIEGALWRHYSWAEFMLPAGVLLAFAGVGYAVGVMGLRWGEKA